MAPRTRAVGTAADRPSLDELRRRVVEIADNLDVLCEAVAAILEELALPPARQSVDELGALTPQLCSSLPSNPQ